MKIFLSHASEDAEIARAIEIALREEGHTVFLDRSSLESGESYNDRIRGTLADSDLFVFLISPGAVTRGRYTLNEVDLAEARWPRPGGHVLPVLVRPTDLTSVPVYLRAVTILEPPGNVPAAVAEAVARLGRPWWKGRVRRWTPLLALVALAAIGGAAWFGYQHRTTAARVADLLNAGDLERQAGNYAAAWDTYAQAAALAPARPDVAQAQERLSMDWLDNIVVRSGKGTFADIVDKVRPALVRCAVSNEAQRAAERAADCLAHVGWADFLRSREGVPGLDPVQHYRRAIAIDPRNAYAHAMWGFEILRTGGQTSEAALQFKAARESGRARSLVRRLEIAGLLWRSDDEAEQALVVVADDMRKKGDAMPTDAEGNSLSWRLWSIYFRRLVYQRAMEPFLSAVPPLDHLATFRWMFPEAQIPDDKRDAYLYMRAFLEERAGERAHALQTYRALHDTLARDRGSASGSLAMRAAEGLARLAKP